MYCKFIKKYIDYVEYAYTKINLFPHYKWNMSKYFGQYKEIYCIQGNLRPLLFSLFCACKYFRPVLNSLIHNCVLKQNLDDWYLLSFKFVCWQRGRIFLCIRYWYNSLKKWAKHMFSAFKKRSLSCPSKCT